MTESANIATNIATPLVSWNPVTRDNVAILPPKVYIEPFVRYHGCGHLAGNLGPFAGYLDPRKSKVATYQPLTAIGHLHCAPAPRPCPYRARGAVLSGQRRTGTPAAISRAAR